MNILVDAMGGDNAPYVIVNGCIDAVKEHEGFDITLVGNQKSINSILQDRGYVGERIKIVHADEVITNNEKPVRAIKEKKDSSLSICFSLLKEKKGDVLLSAGSTGAILAGGLLILGRIPGVDRPALPTILPTKKAPVMLIDSGANTVCRPINYLQFGIMGSIYMKEVLGEEAPKVGVINVGVEESKGNEIIKQANQLLLESGVNFVGNIEGRDIPEGKVSVAVCDGFTGNVVLKFLEGTASLFFSAIKNIFTSSLLAKIAYLAVKKELKKFVNTVDYNEVGGTPFLGLKGNVIKSHGSANAKTIKSAVLVAYKIGSSTILSQIEEQFKNTEVENVE